MSLGQCSTLKSNQRSKCFKIAFATLIALHEITKRANVGSHTVPGTILLPDSWIVAPGSAKHFKHGFFSFSFFFFKDWISCRLKCLKNIFVLLEWWNMPLVLCLGRQRQEALIETEANWSN